MRKSGRKPTYQERKIINKNGFDSYEWFVQKNTNEFLVIVNKTTGKVESIQK